MAVTRIKHLLFIVFVLMVSFGAISGRKTIIVEGDILDVDGKKTELFLFNIIEGEYSCVAQTVMEEGKFRFAFTVPNNAKLPVRLLVSGSGKLTGSNNIWACEDTTFVSGKGYDMTLWKADNATKEQADENMLRMAENNINPKLNENRQAILEGAKKILSGRVDPHIKDSLAVILDSLVNVNSRLEEAVRLAQLDYLMRQENVSEAGAVYLEKMTRLGIRNGNYMNSYKEDIKAVYAKMSDSLKYGSHGLSIARAFEPARSIGVGDTLIDITARDRWGKNRSLSRYRGKNLLIVLWGDTWESVNAFGELEKLRRKYNKNLAIVGFSLDVDRHIWASISDHYDIRWVNLSDGMGSTLGVGRMLNVDGVPSFIFADQNRVVLDTWDEYLHDNPGSISERIEKYLK